MRKLIVVPTISLLLTCISFFPALAIGCFTCDETTGCINGQATGYLQCDENPCQLKLGNCTYNGGGECFIAGTPIRTPHGTVPIQELREGDLVVSVDDNGQQAVATVTRAYRAIANEYLLLNGTIGVTEEHPFRAGGRWVKARELRIGEVLSTMGGSVTVVNIQAVQRGVRVYNIEVDGTHTFFADGMLVHNKVQIGG